MDEQQNDNNDIESTKLRFQAILSEYQALRNEILQKFHHHILIYSILVPAIGALIFYVLKEKIYDLLLIIPILSSLFAFRYIWEQNVIVTIGNYLRMMEEDIFPKFIGQRSNSEKQMMYWVGWEHYFRDNFPKGSFYKYTIQILFVGIPFFPALFFSAVVIMRAFSMISFQPNSSIPISAHIIVLIIYLFLAIFLSIKLWRS